jgi:hypothetical protein
MTFGRKSRNVRSSGLALQGKKTRRKAPMQWIVCLAPLRRDYDSWFQSSATGSGGVGICGSAQLHHQSCSVRIGEHELDLNNLSHAAICSFPQISTKSRIYAVQSINHQNKHRRNRIQAHQSTSSNSYRPPCLSRASSTRSIHAKIFSSSRRLPTTCTATGNPAILIAS